jgi:hypothetical protein
MELVSRGSTVSDEADVKVHVEGSKNSSDEVRKWPAQDQQILFRTQVGGKAQSDEAAKKEIEGHEGLPQSRSAARGRTAP